MTEILVRLRKFEDYKGRKDVEHNSWFRCSNRLLEDPDFFEFTSDEKLVWIYILSLASQKNSDMVRCNLAHAERVCGLKPNIVKSAIQKLLRNQLLPVDDTQTLRARNVDDTSAVRERDVDVTSTCATDRQTDKQTDTATADVRPADCALDPYRSKITAENWAAWIKAFGDEQWVDAEINKAVAWIHANQKRAPKANFTRFFNNWLSQGWDRHRVTVSRAGPGSSSAQPRTFDRWGKLEPQHVSYPAAEDVIAQMHDPKVQAMTDEQRKASASKVREMIAKTKSL